MNKSAILHIPMSEYAYGTDEEHVTIRLKAQRDDLKECTLFYGDRACRQTPVIFTSVPMHVAASTTTSDYFEVELEKPYKRLCYYFSLFDGQEQSYYYADQFSDHIVDDRSEYYQLPFNHRADIVAPPSWAQDAIIYNIFPDSFATGKSCISGKGEHLTIEENGRLLTVNGKLGGTLKGITENVSYLKKLGVNAIYINPIFTAGEYHKYDLLDYFHIDPCFGSNEDFRELVQTYHENDIRVIIDGVFNHCGWKFFAFEDVVQNGEASKYRDWFYGLTFPVVRPEDPEAYPGYECFGYERMMPKLNTQNPEVEEYFCSVGEYWVREFGIDGWRLDVASEVNDRFWREFHRRVKAINPEAILIGEVWESANHWLDGTIFDSAMNYDFRKHCRRFFAEESIDACEFDSRMTHMRMRYRRQTAYAQLNILDSHDVSRFLTVCQGDRDRYKLAIVYQMTCPGMPAIFYGDECGLEGLLEKDYRRPMEWEKEDELFDFFREMIGLRKENPVLRRGDYRTLQAKEGSKVYQFERFLNGTTVNVLLNMGKEAVDLRDYKVYKEVLAESHVADGKLGPRGYLITQAK
ncbi:MAG: alpha-glycosidase [Lachnospiraceae bacterium]|nr:alpha-glycosidase [Lachnospiraceae bacterium]